MLKTTYYYKPRTGVKINPNHPLAKGLVTFYCINEQSGLTLVDSLCNIDLNFTASGSSGVYKDTSQGTALYYNINDALMGPNINPAPSNFYTGWPVTYFIQFAYPDSVASSPNSHLGGYTSSNTNSFWCWNIFYNNLGVNLALNNNGTYTEFVCTNNFLSAKVVYFIAAEFTTAGQKLYVNGKNTFTRSVATSQPLYGSIARFNIGTISGTNSKQTIEIYCAGYYNRVLSSSEHAQLAANQWQIFDTPLWYKAGANASTFFFSAVNDFIFSSGVKKSVNTSFDDITDLIYRGLLYKNSGLQIDIDDTLSLNGIRKSSLSTQFDDITELSLQNIIKIASPLSFICIDDLYINNVAKINLLTSFDSISDLVGNFIVKSHRLFSFDVINDTSINLNTYKVNYTQFDAINDTSLRLNTYKTLTTQFNVVDDFALRLNTYKKSNIQFENIDDVLLSINRGRQLSFQFQNTDDLSLKLNIYKTAALGFDAINTFSLTPILHTSSTTYVLSPGFDAVAEYVLNPIFKKSGQVNIDNVNYTNLNFNRKLGSNVQVDVIDTLYLNPVVSMPVTTYVLSENFNAVIDYILNPGLKKQSLVQINSIGDVSIYNVKSIPTRQSFDVFDESYINGIRKISRGLEIDIVDNLSTSFILKVGSGLNFDSTEELNLNPYRKIATQTQFSGIDEFILNNIRGVTSTYQFNIVDEYNIDLIVGKIMDIAIENINDVSIQLSARTAFQEGFDAETSFDVTITNSALSYIFTVDITLIDRSVVEFYL